MMSTSLWLQSERLLQPVTAATAHPVKAVVQTGERPDFERTTSSGAPARPGPITSGMPKPRLDFRIPSGSFQDAGGLINDSQVRQRRLTCTRGHLPWPLFDIFECPYAMPKTCCNYLSSRAGTPLRHMRCSTCLHIQHPACCVGLADARGDAVGT